MESAAISGARWAVGKALSPLSDGLVEAWAASSELGPNIKAVKMELLYAEAMLDNARGREIRSHALAELLQELRALAYDAEDVLDELDYFHIQDELEGTFETIDRGCIHNLLRDARHTAKAAAKQLECTSCFSAARGVGDPYEPKDGASLHLLCGAWPCGGDDGESCKCVRRLTTRARSTAHAVGKRLLCSSLLPVDDDVDDQHPSMSRNCKQIICGVCTCTCKAPWKKHAPETPKLDFDRVDVSRRMKHIVEQLQPICAKVSTILDLELSGSRRSNSNGSSTSRSPTISESIEPKMYGRDLEKNTIIEDITKGEYLHKDLTVIPIVGPGGIGKTTLTQYIYNSKEVKEHFPIRVWICVSLDFSVHRLTQEIEESIPKPKDETNGRAHDKPQNLDQLQKLIEERLNNERFLLVLDDIWKYSDKVEWEKLMVPFKKGQGNIVLVTTRFLEVAKMVRTTDKSIQLEGLKPEDFWGFFEACVFGETKQQFKHNDPLLPIGKEIVEKLKRSPLAAKTVGRLLRNDLTLAHWKRILESKEWESQTGDHDIMPALKLSYDYLPFHLQQCFSYCALFPEDYRFDSEELIRFWIGLDILRPGHATKRIEDVGLHYLNELVNYEFFKTEKDEQATYYVIHDLLHDLALKVSSQECLHIASSSSRPIEIPPSIYHLSISMSPANSEDGTIEENFRKEFGKVRNRLKSENLHTLMLFGEYDASFVGTFCDLFKDAKSLRVVHLSIMSHPVEYILHNFSKLVHLRYLRLVTEYGSKVHLPRSLSRFYHLMVLDIQRWRGARSLPRDMTNLVKLRHFLVPYDTLHSNIPNVGKLRCLQELRRFQVKEESTGFELRELGQLSELGGSLGIYNLENVQVNETHEAKLLYKNRLQELTLNWGKDRSNEGCDKEDQVLEGLQPHDSLRELCIDGHGGFTCPTWLGTKLSVKVLEALHLNGVAWKTFPSLGELLIDEHGEKLCGCITGPSFQKLKRLVLVGLPKFRKWIAKKACPMFFSLLEELFVEDCENLTELPFSFYTGHPLEGDGNATWFPRLQVLHIDKCPNLLSLPPIPYSHTLCDVRISRVGTGLEILKYSNKPSSLRIEGNEALHRLDDKVLAFHNLAQLEELDIRKCPPLAVEHLQMFTSLETLRIEDSSNVFMPLERRSDVKWQLPVSRLVIERCGASGKELTQLLSHFPKLSELELRNCEKIKGLSVDAEQQPVSLPSSSSVKMEDRELGHQRHLMAEEVEGDEVVVELVVEEEGLLLFPAHLSNSLRELRINDCEELSLVASPDGRDGEEGWLRALRSLQRLEIQNCPKLLSANSSSSCCPFPSSLQHLKLDGRVEGMETLEPLSNLTSLTRLKIDDCGEDLRGEGLWPLLTRGQLTELQVLDTPKFFAVGWGLRDEDQGHQLLLRELQTDDIAGVLAAPICRLLSSSLTKLFFESNEEVERFTKEQEEALHLLTSLEELQFWLCDKLQCLPAGLHRLTNLKTLDIWSCTAIRSLPKEGLPTSLQQLTIDDCPALRSLPKEGLPNSLQQLTIEDCPGLRSLPKQGLPSSLQQLDVSDCGNVELKQRCRKFTRTIPKIRL